MTHTTRGSVWARLALLGATLLAAGCGEDRTGTTDPEAKLRLEKLLAAFTFHADRRLNTPKDEAEFKAFLRTLCPDDREQLQLGDLDALFVSPRDRQPYVVRYGMPRPDPGGATRAVAWEKTGANGKRFVALTIGYVEEYEVTDDQVLK